MYRQNDFPKGFESKKLEDVCTLITDGTHDKTPLVDKKEGVPLITSKDLKDEGISFKNVLYITREQHEQIIKRSKPEKGDILYSKIGTIGKPTIVDSDIEFGIKNVALFKLKREIISNKYLKYYLKYEPTRKVLLNIAGEGNQKFIPLSKLKKIEIFLPPLPLKRKSLPFLKKLKSSRGGEEKLMS